MRTAARKAGVTPALLRGTTPTKFLQTACQDGWVVPRRPLRVAGEVARVLAARVRVGVAGGVAEEGLPDGLAEDAVVRTR